MLVVLETLFSAPESYRSTKLLNSLAQGYDHYCVWFARGDSRKVYFEKSILLLTESIKKDPNQTYARAQLGALLIDQKLVRNLEKGIGLLNELKESGKLPDHLNSTLSKAQRQTGDLKANQEFDLCVYTDPSPAVFSEERKRFRALIRTYVKNNESENLIRCLNEYYNLAILVYACYGDFDCSSGTIGWKYDAAVEIVKSVCQEIDFDYRTTGKLIGANYISARDWGTFKKHFGDVGMEANLSTMVSKLSSNYSQYKDPF